ncbi:MAG: FecR domain-containing protein [Candidatus Saccharicenans sp.]|nr:FecR domain-containing protein [Candidatus Saccharicenans sp.]
MKKIYLWLILGVLGVGLLQPAAATGKHYTLVSGERNFYYGYISYIPEETGARVPEVIRVGLTGPEPVRLNFPLGPGDVIVTYDKPCEIQFDSGTIVRLGTDTRLKIETIMAQSLSSDDQLSNLVLEKGQIYLMYTAYNSWEVFQLLTVNAALKMKNKTVLIVRVTDDGETRLMVKEGKANLLYGPSAGELKTLTARKGTGFLVDAGHRVESKENFPEFSPFEAWNAELNKHFLELHKGLTPLPKPIQKLPPAVFYFAQYYGNKYGEWVWDDYFGYVWRPFYNDYYPWGNWSPYYYGNWTYLNGQLFWVPVEPWGWVPYHLGIWQWDKKKGWIWIPGSAFAPAWAVWDFYFGYYSWRPWSLYDWLGYYGYGYGYWDYYGPIGTVLPPGGASEPPAVRQITKNQLKKPQGQVQTVPVPDSYKKIVASLARAIDRGDREVLQRISARPPEPMLVRPADLDSRDLSSRRISMGELAAKARAVQSEGDEPALEKGQTPAWNLAVFRFLRNRNETEAEKVSISRPEAVRPRPLEREAPKQPAPSSAAENRPQLKRNSDPGPLPGLPGTSDLRFRDWNPDLKMAHQLGVRIVYDSSKNLIVSPELKITSREASGLGVRIAPSGLVLSRTGGGSSGYSDGSSSSSGSFSKTASASSAPASRGSGSERSGGSKASSSGHEKH